MYGLVAALLIALAAPVAHGQGRGFGGSGSGSGSGSGFRAAAGQQGQRSGAGNVGSRLGRTSSSASRAAAARNAPASRRALERVNSATRRNQLASTRSQTRQPGVSRSRIPSGNSAVTRRAPPSTAASTLRSLGPNRWALGGGARALELNRSAVRNVLAGAQDDEMAERPHGVFDAGRRGALGVVSEAWDRAQRGGAGVSVQRQRNGATVYTVAMDRRVGFIGGRMGAQAGRPEAQHVRLVVRNGALLTAFPTQAARMQAQQQASLVTRASGVGGSNGIGVGAEGAFDGPDVGGPNDTVTPRFGSLGSSSGGVGDALPSLDLDDGSLSLLDRQTRDDPSLSRSHGVFDGGRSGAVSVVREAWERVRTADPSVTTRPGRSEGATVYRVNLGREVGFVGGVRGAQQGNPRASSIELVIRNGRLLTA
jgi:hypothetical protein